MAKSEDKENPIVNLKGLKEQTGGDMKFALECVELLLTSDKDEQLKRIDVGIKEDNHKEFEEGTHSIKGASSNLQLLGIWKAATNINNLGKDLMHWSTSIAELNEKLKKSTELKLTKTEIESTKQSIADLTKQLEAGKPQRKPLLNALLKEYQRVTDEFLPTLRTLAAEAPEGGEEEGDEQYEDGEGGEGEGEEGEGGGEELEEGLEEGVAD